MDDAVAGDDDCPGEADAVAEPFWDGLVERAPVAGDAVEADAGEDLAVEGSASGWKPVDDSPVGGWG